VFPGRRLCGGVCALPPGARALPLPACPHPHRRVMSPCGQRPRSPTAPAPGAAIAASPPNVGVVSQCSKRLRPPTAGTAATAAPPPSPVFLVGTPRPTCVSGSGKLLSLVLLEASCFADGQHNKTNCSAAPGCRCNYYGARCDIKCLQSTTCARHGSCGDDGGCICDDGYNALLGTCLRAWQLLAAIGCFISVIAITVMMRKPHIRLRQQARRVGPDAGLLGLGAIDCAGCKMVVEAAHTLKNPAVSSREF
jgi:hypothetical protein